MAILKTDNEKELVATCNCGCDEGIHIRIDSDDYDYYAYQCFTNGCFYQEQYGMFGTLKKKIKKIWAIIRNKDYYYSDIVMNKEEFETFKKWINQF